MSINGDNKQRIEELLDSVRNTLDEGSSLLGGAFRDETLRRLFSEYLSYYGYVVISPSSLEKVYDAQGLVRYFYNSLNYYKPNVGIRASINFNKDLAIAKRFIDNRLKAIGQSRQAAIMDCVSIIKTLFLYEKEFKLKYPVRELSVFSGDRLFWIISRAYQIMNKPGAFEDVKFEEDSKRMLEEYVEEFGDQSFLDMLEEKENG